MCQRRRLHRLAVPLLAAAMVTPVPAESPPCLSGPESPAPAAVMTRTRALARALGLPVPRWVEVAPIPDEAAGVTFGPVIRLHPAPGPVLLATLFHEAGHLGAIRARPVEEAVADLTRRALVAKLLERDPESVLPLLPVLVPLPAPLSQVDPGTASRGDPGRTGLSLYREAGLLAIALWEAVPRSGDGGDPGSQARRLARAAKLGRALPSHEVMAMAPAGAAGRRAALQRFAAGHVVPLLTAAGRVAGGQDQKPALLLKALAEPETLAGWLDWARVALQTDDAGRILAHGVLALRAPGDAGELAYLDDWVSLASREEDALSLERALVRRGTLQSQLGRAEAAAEDLMGVLLEGRNVVPAAEAAVALARTGILSQQSMADLLDLAPAVAACGALGTAVKALALRTAGHGSTALSLFPYGRLPAPDWGYTAAWAEALAASGRQQEAAALLRRRAGQWRHLQGGRLPAAAALMAAVFMEGDGDPRLAERAAREINRAGAAADHLLAAAARRWQDRGQTRKAKQAWRRLLRQDPASDQAAAARRALAETP